MKMTRAIRLCQWKIPKQLLVTVSEVVLMSCVAEIGPELLDLLLLLPDCWDYRFGPSHST